MDTIKVVVPSTPTTYITMSQGIPGPQGQSGYSGYSGLGLSGYSGEPGPQGLSGYSGSGLSGYSGEQGISGYSGERGISGYSGQSGYSGTSGYSGSGISGYSGFSGSGVSGYSGTSGYSGLPGTGLTAKGAWSDSVTYVLNDLATYDGNAWLSLQNGNLNNIPEEGTYWTLFSAQGADGISGYSGYSGTSPNIDASDTEVVFQDGATPTGDSTFTFDKVSKILTASIFDVGGENGVRISATDGVVTFLGLKEVGENRSLTLDFESNANRVYIQTTQANVIPVISNEGLSEANYIQHFQIKDSTTTIQAGIGGKIGFVGNISSSTERLLALIGGVKENGTEEDGKGNLIFCTRTGLGNLIEAGRIGSNQNWGLGKTPGVYRLDVEGDINISAGYRYKIGDVNIGDPPGDDTHIAFNDGGLWGADSNFTFDKVSGDVFIGGTLTALNISGTNTGDQVGDGITISGAGTEADPFIIVPGSVASSFIQLTDVPSTYEAQSGKILKVNSTEDGIIFAEEAGSGAVSSVFGRTGDVTASLNDYTWDLINKEISDIADITDRSHTDLTDIGTNTHEDIDNHISDTSIHTEDDTLVHLAGNETITGLKTFNTVLPQSTLTPTSEYDFVTLGWVSTFSQGLVAKEAVTAATIENISLYGPQTIDTILVVAGDRVLVKNQDTASENGIYVVSASSGEAWTRALDYNADSEIIAGTFCYVLTGALNGGFQFVQITKSPTLGVSDLEFVILNQPNSYTASNGIKLIGFDLQIDLSDTNPSLEMADGGLRVLVDNSSIERSAAGLQVKLAGVTSGMLAGSISDIKLSKITTAEKVSGTALIDLDEIPTNAGIIPIANLASGTPTGTKFIRDDGTLAIPDGSGGGTVESIVAGDGINVDDTDPANPVVSSTFIPATPYAEIPTGDVDGVNTIFTLANTPTYPTNVIVVLDGVTQYNGTDYTVTDDTITFTTAPATGSTIFAYYSSAGSSGVGAVFNGLSKITVSVTAPTNPSLNDLWVDIS